MFFDAPSSLNERISVIVVLWTMLDNRDGEVSKVTPD